MPTTRPTPLRHYPALRSGALFTTSTVRRTATTQGPMQADMKGFMKHMPKSPAPRALLGVGVLGLVTADFMVAKYFLFGVSEEGSQKGN